MVQLDPTDDVSHVQLDTHSGDDIALYLHFGTNDESILIQGKRLTLFYDVSMEYEEDDKTNWTEDSFIVMSEHNTMIEVYAGHTEIYSPSFQAWDLPSVNESFKDVKRAFANPHNNTESTTLVKRSKRQVSVPNISANFKVFAKSIQVSKR